MPSQTYKRMTLNKGDDLFMRCQSRITDSLIGSPRSLIVLVALIVAGMATPACAMEGHIRAGPALGYDGAEGDGTIGLQLGASLEWAVNESVSLGPELRLAPTWFVVTVAGDPSVFLLPISLSVRCAFLPKAKVSPYVRAGVSYIVATSEGFYDSTPGFEGAVGVEFFRNKWVGFGIEGGWNTCSTKIIGIEVKPLEYFVGMFATFKFGKK